MIESGDAWGLWEDQVPVASVLTLAYGKRFAWISMVLVTQRWRRRGIATELLRQAIEHLCKQNLVAGLDATDAGREIYLPLGFCDIYPLSRLQTEVKQSPQQLLTPSESATIRALQLSDLSDLASWDAVVFGADRALLLKTLYQRLPRCAYAAYNNAGQIKGFILGRDGRQASQIGPLVAESETLAQSLFNHALASLSGPVFIDAVTQQTSWLQFLKQQGFVFQRGFMRMLLGQEIPLDDARRIYAIAGPELG